VNDLTHTSARPFFGGARFTGRGLTMLRPSIAAFALALSGCVSVGTNYSEAAAAQLRPGMSEAEVIQRLGKPNSVVTLSDGRQQLGWTHSEGSMFGAKARSLTLPFSADGVLLQVPGGTAALGAPAVAVTSTARLDALSSHVETNTVATSTRAVTPTATAAPGVTQLGPDIWLYPAPTPSGHCIQAPANYQGTGAANRPAITGSLPRCSNSH
jgi:hypothetical protein